MFSGPGVLRTVQHTRELERVLRLPRRQWGGADSDRWAAELSAVLRLAQGSMTLRPIQAQALFEAGTLRGLFAPIGVGHGKTLITALAPYILQSRRPLLITRANLIEEDQARVSRSGPSLAGPELPPPDVL